MTGSGRRGSRRKRKAGEDGELAGSFGETLDRVNGAVEHAHRPTNIHHVTNAQVFYPILFVDFVAGVALCLAPAYVTRRVRAP